MSITQNGKVSNSYTYSMNGQVASATNHGSSSAKATGGQAENFIWDGLALIKRGTTEYVYEPAVTGGNPILANGKGMFNDMLGNTLGVIGEKDKFTSIKRDAFGKTLENKAGNQYNMFTGKPQIGGLGYAFLFRNYRSDLGKWQTADPIATIIAVSGSKNMKLRSEFMASLGYPDGWNNLAYVNNEVTIAVDPQGCLTYLGTIDAVGVHINDIPETIYETYAEAFAAARAHLNDAIANAHSLIIAEANSTYPGWTHGEWGPVTNIAQDINGSGDTWSWVSVSMYTFGKIYE